MGHCKKMGTVVLHVNQLIIDILIKADAFTIFSFQQPHAKKLFSRVSLNQSYNSCAYSKSTSKPHPQNIHHVSHLQQDRRLLLLGEARLPHHRCSCLASGRECKAEYLKEHYVMEWAAGSIMENEEVEIGGEIVRREKRGRPKIWEGWCKDGGMYISARPRG
jgi:hypothetical protein